jgi:pseudaminic acid synthase
MSGFTIAGRPIGPGHPPYVIAELSGNHNGDMGRALALIDAAAAAGADAVKLQTYTADTMTIDHDGPGFHIEGGPWDGRTLYDLYREAHTPWEWHAPLYARAKAAGVACFSSPFDSTAVDFLEQLGTPAYKIASFEIVDIPLIKKVASTGKPVIISTGMASQAEISDAVSTAREAGAGGVMLLHCVSAYPTPAAEAHLARMAELRNSHGTFVGLSDHTLGHEVAIAAVALGASVIEKHVTLRRADGGPDAGFSLEPGEFKQLCDGAKTAHSALGSGRDERTASEEANYLFRRSLYVVADVRAGECFTADNVRAIRPGLGMPPKDLPGIFGRRAACDIARGTPMSTELIADSGPAK